jgi:hypothetical protein
MKRLDLVRIIEKTVLFLSGMAATMIGIRTIRPEWLKPYHVIGK